MLSSSMHTLSILITISLFLSSCALTSRLYGMGGYKETVSSILVTEDKKKIIFIGEDHHYIFDAPESLVKTLSASFYPYTKAYFSQFDVQSDGSISGIYMLTVPKNINKELRQEVVTLGYKFGAFRSFELTGRLTGVRYSSEGLALNAATQNLNQTYTITIKEESGVAGKVSKALVTPLTITAGGVMAIGGVTVMATAFYICAAQDKNCK